MIRILAVLLVAIPAIASAESLVAARTIRSQAILTAADLSVVSAHLPGAMADPANAIGMESRVVLYAGRPIRASDIGPPAVVGRNEIVLVHYRNGPLNITMEGRTLGRAGIGDRVRIMNLESRSTVTGTVNSDGSIVVHNALPRG